MLSINMGSCKIPMYCYAFTLFYRKSSKLGCMQCSKNYTHAQVNVANVSLYYHKLPLNKNNNIQLKTYLDKAK